MNVDKYRQRLLDMETTLSLQTARAVAEARGSLLDTAHDISDAAVAGEVASEQFTEADHDYTVLKQVREALARIGNGTFGECVVDGAPIEEARLDAVPWTPYCLKHEKLLESTPPGAVRD